MLFGRELVVRPRRHVLGEFLCESVADDGAGLDHGSAVDGRAAVGDVIAGEDAARGEEEEGEGEELHLEVLVLVVVWFWLWLWYGFGRLVVEFVVRCVVSWVCVWGDGYRGCGFDGWEVEVYE